MDLVFNQLDIIQSKEDASRANISLGLLDTNIESRLLELDDTVHNTADIFAASEAEGIGWD